MPAKRTHLDGVKLSLYFRLSTKEGPICRKHSRPAPLRGNPCVYVLSLHDRARGARTSRIHLIHLRGGTERSPSRSHRSPTYSIRYGRRSACGITACGRRTPTCTGFGGSYSFTADVIPRRWEKKRSGNFCRRWPWTSGSAPPHKTKRSTPSSSCTVTCLTSTPAG